MFDIARFSFLPLILSVTHLLIISHLLNHSFTRSTYSPTHSLSLSLSLSLSHPLFLFLLYYIAVKLT
jgi:hypothetical protein